MLPLLLTCVYAIGVRAGTCGRVRADVHDGVGRHLVGFTLQPATANSQQLVRLHQDRHCSAQVSQRGQAHGHRILLTYHAIYPLLPLLVIMCGGNRVERCESGARAVRELACTDEHDPPFCGQLAGDLVGLVGYRGNDVSHQDVAVSAQDVAVSAQDVTVSAQDVAVSALANDVSHQDVAVSALAQVSRLAFLSPSSPLDLSPDRLTWVCL